MSEEKKDENKGGRPSKFSEDYIFMVHDYLKQCEDKYIKIGDRKQLKVSLPTIEGYALFLGVNKTSLYEWEKKNDHFSNALDKIRSEQQKRLIDMGLSNEYNPTIAKLILSSNHGMRERNDITSDDEKIEGVNINVRDFSNKNGDKS